MFPVMWAAATASILLALSFCSAEEAPLKWSKPASERVNGDWVPLSAEQLGQASARSLGAPSQQNHLVRGLYQQDNGNNFGHTFHQQQQQYRPDNAPRQQEKFNQAHALSQQFLPPQIPPHLLAQQLPPQLLNQQFENNFNQFNPHGGPILRPQFVVQQDPFGQPPPPPLRKEPAQQHAGPGDEEEKLPMRNLQHPGFTPQQNSFSDPRLNRQHAARPVDESIPYKKGTRGEKEEVQILYVPVETLKQRARGGGALKGSVSSQVVQDPVSREPNFQPIPSQIGFPKESKKFRHPIQPLKEQMPARHLSDFNLESLTVPKSKPVEQSQRVNEEYDSAKDTSQQVTTSQLKHGEEAKYLHSQQQNYNTRYPTEEPTYEQSNFRELQTEKAFYTEKPRLDYNLNNRYSKMPDSFLLPETIRRPTEVYRDEVRTTKLPPPNQPPLSVYMETSPNNKVGDVLSLLKDAKTIPVLDTIGADSPQVFVGPSNLKPPHGYVKFELPYLSSLDGNRVERKVLQLPFFVAPLNFQPPPGYSKIPFPPPHIGSVVLSNITAKVVTEKYATTPSYSPSSTYRDPYTIPADISSISPQLPSLINSLQEERFGPTTLATTLAAETATEVATEAVQTSTSTRRPQSSRSHHFRGSQRAHYSLAAPTSPATRRPYGQRQRRPYNSTNQSRTNQITTTTTTTEEPYTNHRQRDDQEQPDYQDTQNHQTDLENRYQESAASQATDDETSRYYTQQTRKEPEDQRFDTEQEKPKEFDRNFRTQGFLPYYNSDYYNPNDANVYETEKTPPSRHSAPSISVESQSPPTVPAGYRPQQQSENQQSVYSSVESQFAPRPVNPDHNRHFASEPHVEKEKPSVRNNAGYSTTEVPLQRQQYKANSDELPYGVYDSDSVGVGQLPPEYNEDELRPKSKEAYFPQSYDNPSFNVDATPKQQNVPSYDVNYKPVQYTDYTTQSATDYHTQSDFKDYPSPTSSRNNLAEPASTTVTEPPEQLKHTYKPETLYGNEEEVGNPAVKHKTRGRVTHEQTSSDDYLTKTTSENYVETTTRVPSERPNHLRSRGRVRGRPLYSRQKTTTETPNYPSNYGESRERRPIESYKEEKRVTADSGPNSFNSGVYNNAEDTKYTTPPPTEATTRTLHRKFNNHRTVQRRPIKPTTTPAPATTTSAPIGVKYLIRTRRPVSAPQTKLHSGRGRIRRPTTPTTTTTTETPVTETERWTVPQLPIINYREDDAVYNNPPSVKGNQYDSFSRSPTGPRDENNFEQYQTTPTVIENGRFSGRPKSQESSYADPDDEALLHPVERKNKPAPNYYDEGLEYEPYNQNPPQEPARKVTFKPREQQTVINYEDRTEQNDNYQTYETSKRPQQRHREPPYTTRNEQEERGAVHTKATGKHRGSQGYYHEENFEVDPVKSYKPTRRPLVRHRESHTNPPVYDQTEDKTVYQSDKSPLSVIGQHVESKSTSPPPSVDLPLEQNFKQFATTPKIVVYNEPNKDTYSEDKYITERNPVSTPDRSHSDNQYSPNASKQKEAEDFWNQAVTIQQSKSYVYTPDDIDSGKMGNGKPNSDQPVFNEYDDYPSFQDSDKPITSDQSPFPSNDQQITYTGLKPDLNVGKANQYHGKDAADELAKPQDDSTESVEKAANDRSSTVEDIPQESSSESMLNSSKKPGRRRGTWVKVRVKKPKDFFETAESQRFGSLTSNSLPLNKIDADEKNTDKNKETVEKTANKSAELDPSANDTTTDAPSVMDQFQNTLTTMIKDYMIGGNEEKNKEKHSAVEEIIQTTTEPFETTTVSTFTEEEPAYTTSKIEEDTQLFSDAPTTTYSYTQTVTPKVLGTSTTTEISLETEICYKGRCVKTKRGKDNRVKDESDLMTVE